MASIEPWMDYCEFERFVRQTSRHILDDKNTKFLRAVLESSKKRRHCLARGHLLWRAQHGCEWSTENVYGEPMPVPYSAERMKPLSDRAREGRVNPKGIPFLYCSTDRDTAMSETRPWIGSRVTLAEVRLLRDLNVVDCSGKEEPVMFSACLNSKEAEYDPLEDCLWKDIDLAFAQPINRADEDVAEYAPTQVLAEAFRIRGGYDGIVYSSKLGEGKTIAIFDLDAAEIGTREVHQVDAIDVWFSPARVEISWHRWEKRSFQR